MSRHTFARLVRHFAAVIVNHGQDEGAAELNLGIGGLLAILAVPGAFFTFTLFDKYSSLLRFLRGGRPHVAEVISIPDKYFFIVFSMVVTGVVAALKWDRIFPSRQDYANLAPLPLRPLHIFAANLTAILLLAGIFAIDVNAASALFFPLVVVAGGEARIGYFAFLGAHAVSVVLASAFTFFACFAITGALLATLPQAAFRRVSLFVRLAILIALMTLLCTTFAVPSRIFRLAAHPAWWMRWLPPVWYLAFYQKLQGRADGGLERLAPLAWQATAGAGALAVICGALSYRRYFRRIPESRDSRQTAARRPMLAVSRWLDPWFLKDPFERACYHFSLRALLRSETHCILFGAFAGLGLITAAQAILDSPRGGPLVAPLCFAYFLAAGLRLAFELPAGLSANWVYRLTADQGPLGSRQAASIARKLLLTFLLPFVVAPGLAIALFSLPPGLAVAHAFVVALFALLLVETLLIRFRKIPFTCSTPAFENNAIVLILTYVVGFFAFTGSVSALENWMLKLPVRFLALLPILAAAWYGIRQANYEPGDPGARLVYDARPPDAVQTLNLSGAR